MLTKRLLLVFGLLLGFAGVCQAAKVETRQVPSAAMKKDIPATIILPNSYAQGTTPYPVLYLLHGISDNHSAWNNKSGVSRLVDQYNFIVVCPDGGTDSWYLDAPDDPTRCYETHISKELVGFVDGNYRTIKTPQGRAISGLSMGGHGGLFMGIRHQDVFGACGSMSGAVDLTDIAWGFNLKDRLGPVADHPERYKELSVIGNIDKITPQSKLAIIFDCGVEDGFVRVNRALHEALLKNKIPHDYTERPGNHDWNYWGNAIQYQALFFHNYFESAARENGTGGRGRRRNP